jgi:hypothetical protein
LLDYKRDKTNPLTTKHLGQIMAKLAAETKFFEFHQNNSGGSFSIDDERGIGPNVWVEALNEADANSRAEGLGIYFDGVDDGIDCECCGDRWYPAWGEGKAAPELDANYDFGWHDTVYVHLIDGTIERRTNQTPAAA